MATRAIEILNMAYVQTFEVAGGGSAVAGYGAMLASDTTATITTAITDNAVGIFLDTAAAAAHARVAMWGAGFCKGKVGTGGATAGAPLKWVADGLTDATVGGGTGKLVVCGQARQTGVATDLIGVNLAGFSFSVGS
jgi:hypothetical protein